MCGMRATTFDIPYFKDEKLISKLPLQPIGFHTDPNVEQRLAGRGKSTLEYQRIACKEYTGVAFSASYCDEDQALDSGLSRRVNCLFYLQYTTQRLIRH